MNLFFFFGFDLLILLPPFWTLMLYNKVKTVFACPVKTTEDGPLDYNSKVRERFL